MCIHDIMRILTSSLTFVGLQELGLVLAASVTVKVPMGESSATLLDSTSSPLNCSPELPERVTACRGWYHTTIMIDDSIKIVFLPIS